MITMKRKFKVLLVYIQMCAVVLILTSCWDYAELSDLIPIAGIAIDKDTRTGEFVLTLEVIQPDETGNSIQSLVLEGRGETIHEAFRETITTTGSMAGASHAAVLIIDKNIAKNGITEVLDLVDRDVEVRSDMLLYISGEESAGEIFKKTKDLGEIISYQLANTANSQSKCGRFIATKLYEFVDELARDGISPAAANIRVGHTEKDIIAKVEGTHVFKKDKLIGFLDGNETFFLSFIRDENKLSTVIPVKLPDGSRISLEMVNYKKKFKPHLEGDEICFDVIIDINALISEIQPADYSKNYISQDNRYLIKAEAERYVSDNIKKLVDKAQSNLGSDIFGYGEIVKKKLPSYWEKYSEKWDEEFKLLKVYVETNVHLRGSALLRDSIKVGD